MQIKIEGSNIGGTDDGVEEKDIISIDEQFGRKGERKRGNVIEENDEEKRNKD